MKAPVRVAAGVGLALPLLLSGCVLFPTTRHLPLPKAPPGLVQTATPEQLVALLNQRWDALDSLTAEVDIQATELKTAEGVAKTYNGIRADIVIGKPERLRVFGKLLLGIPAFDMASNGQTFTLKIPEKNVAFEGSDTAKGTSKEPFENLRPPFFFDAMVVRGVNPENHYFVTSETATMEDAKKKHLYSVPEYILNINRVNPGSPKETAVRVITFHRSDMLPYAQVIYDSEGEPETYVTYSTYESFENVEFPSTISIRSPLAGIELVLTVDNVQENVKLNDEQFKIELPKGIKITHLK